MPGIATSPDLRLSEVPGIDPSQVPILSAGSTRLGWAPTLYCCNKIDTVPSVLFDTARSSFPSPLNSAHVIFCPICASDGDHNAHRRCLQSPFGRCVTDEPLVRERRPPHRRSPKVCEKFHSIRHAHPKGSPAKRVRLSGQGAGENTPPCAVALWFLGAFPLRHQVMKIYWEVDRTDLSHSYLRTPLFGAWYVNYQLRPMWPV